jgi:hypothetical protein
MIDIVNWKLQQAKVGLLTGSFGASFVARGGGSNVHFDVVRSWRCKKWVILSCTRNKNTRGRERMVRGY